MRTVSLIPSATEIVFALGLEESLVGVTHECDYPPAAANCTQITRNLIAEDLTSAAVDAAVQLRLERGENIYELDRDLLIDLQPDLILTQALCEVCAVSYDEVHALAEEMSHDVKVVSLDPHTLGEVLGSISTVAQITGVQEHGETIVNDLAKRVDAVRSAVKDAKQKPKVLALEWLDPPYIAGHWTPQMIEYAGGIDVIAMPGEHSEQTQWNLIEALDIDSVFIMPCGYRLEEAKQEAEKFSKQLANLGASNYYAANGSDYFSRPGPRLVDGLEFIAHTLHPDLFPQGKTDQIEKITI